MHTKVFTKMYVARRQLGISQQELADRIGVTQPRISSWENGSVSIPLARRADIAKVLGMPEDELDQPAL